MSMNLDDLLKALGQAANTEPESTDRAGGNPTMDLLGGLLGGATQKPSGTQSAAGGKKPKKPRPGGTQSAGGGDIGNLLGSLLGGSTSQQQPMGGGGLGGLLGGLLGGGASIQSGMAANPILDPLTKLVSQKTGLPPAIASMAVSFAMSQIIGSLTNQAQGGGSQRGLQDGNLAKHLTKGHPVDESVLASSGLAQKFADQSGLDLPTATQALEQALGAIGPTMAGGSVPNARVARTTKSASSKKPKRKTK